MSDTRGSDEKQNAIRQRAHAIWEQEGRPEGRSEEHWHQAQRAVSGMSEEAASWQPETDGSESYGEKEQPVAGEPDPDSGVTDAAEQAGESVPKPSTPEDIPGKPTGARALPNERKPRG